MKLFIMTSLTAIALSVCPRSALAYDCSRGGEFVSTTSDLTLAVEPGNRAVVLKGRTTRTVEDINACQGSLRIEGWIAGDPAGAGVDQDNGNAYLGHCPDCIGSLMIIPCTAATYNGTTKHWWIQPNWFSPPTWVHLADLTPFETVDACEEEPPPPEEDCSTTGNCEDLNPPGSPIIVDTAADGLRLTSPADGVWFDLNGDGNREWVAWTLPESDDGWLAMDRNGNGRIDNGSELFGNNTPAYAGQPRPTAANGFIALNFLENPVYGGSLGDQVIDSHDAAYGRLLVWIDRNHNGESESSELRPIADLGLVAIETEFKESKHRDRHGNEYRQRALGWWADTAGQASARYLYDVWLKVIR